MFSAAVLVPVLFHLCFRQNRFVLFYDSVIFYDSMVPFWSFSFITTLLLVMEGFSFHGTVGYYNVSCGLVCFSDHRNLIRNVMRLRLVLDARVLHCTALHCTRERPYVSEFCVSRLRC